MSNLYIVGVKAAIKPVPGHQSPLQGAFATSDTYYHIVTDTIQNAMAIARARLATGETITSVQLADDSVVVDPSCVAGDKN